MRSIWCSVFIAALLAIIPAYAFNAGAPVPSGLSMLEPVQYGKLPPGYRWIVLASDLDPDRLPMQRYLQLLPWATFNVVKTRTGYWALIIGPYERRQAESIAADLKARGFIPYDAYLSSGNGFLHF